MQCVGVNLMLKSCWLPFGLWSKDKLVDKCLVAQEVLSEHEFVSMM